MSLSSDESPHEQAVKDDQKNVVFLNSTKQLVFTGRQSISAPSENVPAPLWWLLPIG